MQETLRKTLYALSNNARITTKELGKYTRKSQQASSYIIQKLRKEKKIIPATIVDTSKFDYVNLLVGITFLKFEDKYVNKFLEHVKGVLEIIKIEETSAEIDVILEFCSPNLSSFNKELTQLIDDYTDIIEVSFVYPIIVKHIHGKNYLAKKSLDKDIIICGDRPLIVLSKNEKEIFNALVQDPKASLLQIQESTKISLPTIRELKKKLEQKEIIRGYEYEIEPSELPIKRRYLLLNIGRDRVINVNKFRTFAVAHPNIISFTKIIGKYNIACIIEEENDEIKVLQTLRKEFPINAYKSIYIKKIIKYSHFPIKNKSTEE